MKIQKRHIFGILFTLFLIAFLGALYGKQVKASGGETKILVIGHSYSLNSCEYLKEIAKSQDADMIIGIAYRGNCSLQSHYEYLRGDVVYNDDIGYGYYKKYVPGQSTAYIIKDYTLKVMLTNEDWDYIIFQECLDTAGNLEVVSEWMEKLYMEVREIMRENDNRDVQYLYHQIWAMENVTYNPASKEKAEFYNYNYDSDTMYQMVSNTSRTVAEKFRIGLLPTGEAFQIARSHPMFQVAQGGKKLIADDVNHANEYGMYLAGVTWFESIMQMEVNKETVFYPYLLSKEEADVLVDCAKEAVEKNTLYYVPDVPEINQETSETDSEKEFDFQWLYLVAVAGVGMVFVFFVRKSIVKKKNSSCISKETVLR